MPSIQTLAGYPSISLVEQKSIITVLIVTAVFFLILLILGVRKSYKLKAENERLSKSQEHYDEKKPYKDFTEGHLYGNNQQSK